MRYIDPVVKILLDTGLVNLDNHGNNSAFLTMVSFFSLFMHNVRALRIAEIMRWMMPW